MNREQLVTASVDARPVLPRRLPNPDRERDPDSPKTIVVRRAEPGQLARAHLARWPYALRARDYYTRDKPIPVPTY